MRWLVTYVVGSVSGLVPMVSLRGTRKSLVLQTVLRVSKSGPSGVQRSHHTSPIISRRYGHSLFGYEGWKRRLDEEHLKARDCMDSRLLGGVLVRLAGIPYCTPYGVIIFSKSWHFNINYVVSTTP